MNFSCHNRFVISLSGNKELKGLPTVDRHCQLSFLSHFLVTVGLTFASDSSDQNNNVQSCGQQKYK